MVDMEYRGIPISLPHLRELSANGNAPNAFIGRNDDFHLYDDKGSFARIDSQIWRMPAAGRWAGRGTDRKA